MMQDRPKIICLCGSTKFIETFAVKTWELELEGHIVLGCTLLPSWYCPVRDHFAEQQGVKPQRDAHHLKKIDLADEVLVLNVGGYIGESTRNEIAYATAHGKPVNYLEPIEATDSVAAVPPVDRTKLCTTDGRPAAEARASQTNETGQHASYVVLCEEERRKGFVRPYRDSYKHVGALQQLVDDAGADSHQVRAGGCGSVTTMGRALSETYARDPHFYGATFCCQCNRHMPVAEFTWTADGKQVGS